MSLAHIRLDFSDQRPNCSGFPIGRYSLRHGLQAVKKPLDGGGFKKAKPKKKVTDQVSNSAMPLLSSLHHTASVSEPYILADTMIVKDIPVHRRCSA
jgi:hypothetical protein